MSGGEVDLTVPHWGWALKRFLAKVCTSEDEKEEAVDLLGWLAHGLGTANGPDSSQFGEFVIKTRPAREGELTLVETRYARVSLKGSAAAASSSQSESKAAAAQPAPRVRLVPKCKAHGSEGGAKAEAAAETPVKEEPGEKDSELVVVLGDDAAEGSREGEGQGSREGDGKGKNSSGKGETSTQARRRRRKARREAWGTGRYPRGGPKIVRPSWAPDENEKKRRRRG